MKTIISFITFVYGKSPPKNKEISMNDNEIGNPPIKALIVFKDNGDTDNLYVPIYAMLSGRRGLTYDVPRMSFGTRIHLMTSSTSNGPKR